MSEGKLTQNVSEKRKFLKKIIEANFEKNFGKALSRIFGVNFSQRIKIKFLFQPNGLIFICTPSKTLLAKFLVITVAESLGVIKKGSHKYEDFISYEDLQKLLEKCDYYICQGCQMENWKLPDIFMKDATKNVYRDTRYIVSCTIQFRALLLVHFSQCLYERIFFFHFGESRAMKGVIFFFIFKILKRGFRKKKSKKTAVWLKTHENTL